MWYDKILELFLEQPQLWEWGLLGVMVVLLGVSIAFYIRYYRSIIRISKKKDEGLQGNDLPSVSVVIYTHDEAPLLAKNLPMILEQQYRDFEVIVVNDGTTEETEDILTMYEKQYPNLRRTFLPVEAKSTSRRKMALNIGVKAARHDVIIMTTADCRVYSTQWMEHIARHFDEKTQVVVGINAGGEGRSTFERMVAYNSLWVAMENAGYGSKIVPFRGSRHNLAFRKSAFVKARGYVASMGHEFGDDDLMISQFATSKNTRYEVSVASIVEEEAPEDYKTWYARKWRRLSTFPYYEVGIKTRVRIEKFTRYGMLFGMIGMGIVCVPALKVAAIVLWLVHVGLMMGTLNRTAKVLGRKGWHLDAIVFELIVPLIDFYILSLGQRYRTNVNI